MKTLLVVLLILGCVSSTLGQIVITASKCEKWENTPQACQAVLAPYGAANASMVWTAPNFGLTQEYFNGLLWPYLDLPPTLNMDCAQLFLRLICPTLFQPCTPHPLNPALAIPHPPCQSVCQDYNAQCAKFRPIDCSAKSPLTGKAQWPNYTSPLDPAVCSLMPLDALVEPEFPCPAGLHFLRSGDPKTDNHQVCAMTCADFITINVGYRSTTQNDAWVFLVCLGAISLALNMFLLITLCIFPSTRQFPRRIVIFICIGIAFLDIGIVGNIPFGSAEAVFCDDSTYKSSFAFESSTWCKFSGWAIFFGGQVILFWWATQALVLFWNVALMKNPADLAKMEPLFHIINWSYPLISSFVVLGIGDMGSIPGYPYCFVSVDAPPGIYWGLFFATFAFCDLFVIIMIVCVMVRLSRESTLKDTFWSRWKYQIQLGLFGIYFLFEVTYILALRSWVEAHLTELRDNFTYIYTCLFLGYGPQACETPFPINNYLYYSNVFLIGFTGIMIWIVFWLLNEFNRNLWPLAYRNMKEGRSLFYLPGSGTGTSGASGGSSASSTDDDAAQQRRSNRAFRRKLAADAPAV